MVRLNENFRCAEIYFSRGEDLTGERGDLREYDGREGHSRGVIEIF